MKSPLICDKRDFKWNLLGNILKIFDSRRVKQEMAKQGIKPAFMAGTVFRVLMVAMFFQEDVSYVVSELKEREELRNFVKVVDVPSERQIYEFLARFTEEKFLECILGILNTISTPRGRGKTVILVDSTDIQLDLNWFRRRITKKSLEDRDFKWGYSSSKGYYIGFKLTLALNHHNLKPLAFLIHPGSPNDSKIYPQILEELKRRRLIRPKDTLIFDKGYYSYNNYQLAISRYKIVPLIFPRKDFKLKRALDQISYPITPWENKGIPGKIKKLFQGLKAEFKYKIENWQKYKKTRSKIEDFFKLEKNSLSLTKLHRYTRRSVTKFIYLNALLAGILVSIGYSSKKHLQRLAES
jgi:hypothetical protein